MGRFVDCLARTAYEFTLEQAATVAALFYLIRGRQAASMWSEE